MRPKVRAQREAGNASTGSFVSRCGLPTDEHRNSDNVIVSPGVQHGAFHVHDYVGNLSTDAGSTDQSLQAAGTTCALGDRSTYYWPVLRILGVEDADAGERGGGVDGNRGRILTPDDVLVEFRGSSDGPVRAMPRFLRVLTGDAKVATKADKATAHAQWTCTGFLNRVVTDKYPLCPRGSRVVRIHDFPGCWDGTNTDTEDHRSHMAFARRTGECPQGFTAVPQLRIVLSYRVPSGASYAVDGSPISSTTPSPTTTTSST